MKITNTWKRGEVIIESTCCQLNRLKRIARLIRRAEEKHACLIAYANGPVGSVYPGERGKTFREAAITMAAHARLVQYFNNIVNEIQL